MRQLFHLPLAFSLICGSLHLAAQGRVAPPLREALNQIDAATAAEYAKDKVGSITIGVVSGPGLVWTRSYGYADMESKAPATRNTLYRIGSVTTQFTALMLLQLVQDGKVHLSDPVEKYLPEIDKIRERYPEAPPITLIQLATHTSGLASEPDDQARYVNGPVAEWEQMLFAAVPHVHYVFEPGTRVGYSNIGYALLGAALARSANEPYIEYVRKRIFIPLGMTHTFFELPALNLTELAKGYELEGNKVDARTPQQEHRGRGYKVPNGAIYTTVEDLARFVAFEMGEGPPNVLKQEALEDNFKRFTVLANDNPAYLASGYGIGFRFSVRNDLTSFGHAGGVSGYEARADFDRVSKTGIIALRNTGGKSVHLGTTELVIYSLETVAQAVRLSAKTTLGP